VRPVRVDRHASPLGRWEIARRPPHPGLRAHVAGDYQGYEERMAAPLCRRESPIAAVVLIVSFGFPFELADVESAKPRRRVSFVAGLDERATLVAHDGASAGLQVNFTPLGATRVFGFPAAELAREIVTLGDVFGEREADELVERLEAAPGWAERFDLLDAVLLARVSATAAPPRELAWAWERLAASDGGVAIGALAEEVGWSRRHLAARFRSQLGMGPKTIARVLRFQRAVALLRDEEGPELARIAADCGYFDQAHFTRDVRAFAGVTPTELLAERLPGRGGFAVPIRPRRTPSSPRRLEHSDVRPTKGARTMASSAATTQTIFPTFQFRDARGMIAWLERAFGFEAKAVYGEGETVDHAELAFNDALIMCGSVPRPEQTERLQAQVGPVGVYVVIPDDRLVDEHAARARAAGAEILREPESPDYGGRGYSARDPEGNVWSFGSYRPEQP
jgi:uncharacterized glyoxalase superfamily protein PhnB/AraC-like DNA-binding protein